MQPDCQLMIFIHFIQLGTYLIKEKFKDLIERSLEREIRRTLPVTKKKRVLYFWTPKSI